MSNFEVLYYPYFEPPKKWIRSHLLFFDTVKSIIPEDDEIELSENILELRDEVPYSFKPLESRKKNIKINNLKLERLEKAFQQIKNNNENSTSAKVTIDYSSDEIIIPGRAFLHNNKISHQVFDLLKKFDFIEENSQKICTSIGVNNFYLVNKRASDLIISLVADNIANDYGFNTITHQPLSFTLNSLNSFQFNGIEDARSLLSYSLVDNIIPENIESLDIEEYAVIHKSYKKLHEPFQEVVSSLNTLNRLDDVNDYCILEDKINEITSAFMHEVEDIKNSRTMSNIKKWMPVGIGGLALVSGFIGYEKVAPYIGETSLLLQAIDTYKTNGLSEPSRTPIQRMIGDLQNDIIKASQVKALI